MMCLRFALLAPLMLLAACGSADNADPSGMTASEAQELNDAAAMLDANAVEIETIVNSEAPQ